MRFTVAFALLAFLITTMAALANEDNRNSSAAGDFIRLIYSGGLKGNAEPCG